MTSSSSFTLRNIIGLVSCFIILDQIIHDILYRKQPNHGRHGESFLVVPTTNSFLGIQPQQFQQRFLREYISPHATGWIPSEFPNPLVSPAQCHIQDALVTMAGEEQQQQQQEPNFSYQGNATGMEQQDMTKPRLFFCDPDGIFSDEGVMQISFALRNFTSRYARDDDHNRGDSTRPPCTVNRAQSGRSLSRIQREWKNAENDFLLPPMRMKRNENRDLRAKAAWNAMGGRKSAVSVFGTSFQFKSEPSVIHPEIAVAIVSKMDLPDILHEFSFYTFEDEDDMINDAAQYFASYLHNAWFGRDGTNGGGGAGESTKQGEGCEDQDYNVRNEANGILIFISVADRVCFISSGNAIASVLPWWRLERVVSGMKDDMRSGDYFHAISSAIDDIALLLDEGPPTMSEKTVDFLRRFGVVLLFSSITFFLAICGEYRDRRKRYEQAEFLSEMDDVERDKARILQREFKTDSCPICLESFHNVKEGTSRGLDRGMTRFDSYGIPTKGNDGKEIKILRCGHIFDYTCWRCWITSSSCGDPGICPVCRSNITKRQRERDDESDVHEMMSNNNEEVHTDGYGTFQNERRRAALLNESMSSAQGDGRGEALFVDDQQTLSDSYLLIL